MGGNPAERCKSDAPFLTLKVNNSAISMPSPLLYCTGQPAIDYTFGYLKSALHSGNLPDPARLAGVLRQ
jgi:hypothetical protein